MASTYTSYSPTILIFLQVGEDRIRLADVLYNTATLYKPAKALPGAAASLIFSVDGVESRTEVVLYEGISEDSTLIEFSYSSPEENRWLTAGAV